METKTIFFNGKWYNEKSLKALIRDGVVNNLKKNNDYQFFIKKNQKSFNKTTNEMLTYSLVNNSVNDVYKNIIENSLKTTNN